MIPAYPKPSQVKKPQEAVKVYRDGREVCQDNKAGRDEYQRRKRLMWERQKRRCSLESVCPTCPGLLKWSDSTFDHEDLRSGGRRDDRIENPVKQDDGTVKMKPINGACHHWCNAWRGSKRIGYSEEEDG